MRNVYILLGSVVLAFSIGRYSVRSPEVHDIKSIQTDTKKDENRDTHRDTTITTIKTPDGTVKTVKTITEISDIETKTDTNQTRLSSHDSIPPKTGTINISGLVGNDFSKSWSLTPIYGISVTKEFLGPVTLGGYGLTNGIIGLSIGLNF